MPLIEILMYIYIALFGIVVGSFCNVCILRIPQNESIITTPSHCTKCNKKLRFWHLVPLFSYLFLRGKCAYCKSKISAQYPIIELINGVLWVIVFSVYGLSLQFALGALLASAFLVLSVIDERTNEIPPKINIFIFVIAVINLLFNLSNFTNYILGFAAITAFLMLLFFISKGGAIGGGDVKLMAGCGLLLGLENTILAFVMACVIGSVIHVIRMKFFGKGRVLAMGPYLCVGVFIAYLWGESILKWYFALLGIN